MSDDAELLRHYAESGSNEAFSAFVQRHIDLVYSAAVRRTGGDAHFAKDVAQRVFSAAARQAAVVARHPHPTAWLYETTRFTASSLMRAERRRKLREKVQGEEAQLTSDPDPEWERLAPVLDDAIDKLGGGDRAAVLLRFFDGLAFPEIARRLGLTDGGARLRVERATEKLRRILARKGITSTSAGLALALESQAVGSAPTGLAAAVSASAFGTAGAVASSTWIFMSTTKVILAVVAIAAIGTTLFQLQKSRRAEIAFTQERQDSDKRVQVQAQQIKDLRAQVAALTLASSAKHAAQANQGSGGGVTITSLDLQNLMRTPAYRKLLASAVQGQLDSRYLGLFKSLALPPDKLDQFKNLLTERQLATNDAQTLAREQGINPGTDLEGYRQVLDSAQGPVDSQIKAIIGDAAFDQYQQYETTLPGRNLANQLQQSLSYGQAPLSDDQVNQMIQIFQQGLPANMELGLPVLGPNGFLPTAVSSLNLMSDQILEQAQSVLTPVQMQALKQMQSLQQVQRQLGQYLRSSAQNKANGPTPP